MSGKMSLDEKDVLGEFEKAKVFSCLNANIRKVLSFLRSAYGPKCLCSPGCAVIESL
ncbi:Bgt-20747 [Blumeria graminis f. sp. tritici]|uniref:Bgt-20747 n=2 Tax=Blumeria graminis f. sp. tritici TaxID=62690 RepID=A0A381L1M8_BLUGR|nr:Bgt-20747 [Blumeria graminis f. sp. tritici]